MKKRTKQQRLCACFDAYQKLVGGRPCTAEEVSAWIIVGGLWPVPSVRDDAETAAAWELQFAEYSLQPLPAEASA